MKLNPFALLVVSLAAVSALPASHQTREAEPAVNAIVCKRDPALQAVGPCGPKENKREADPEPEPAKNAIVIVKEREADPGNAPNPPTTPTGPPSCGRSLYTRALNAGCYIARTINASPPPCERALNAGCYISKREADPALNAGNLGSDGGGKPVSNKREPEAAKNAIVIVKDKREAEYAKSPGPPCRRSLYSRALNAGCYVARTINASPPPPICVRALNAGCYVAKREADAEPALNAGTTNPACNERSCASF
ncbi:MAG: hypothetical protein MMC33_008545 [Icmadophila ericetorum]|nr:hypothetical protein [Icmadophila ericetorum]